MSAPVAKLVLLLASLSAAGSSGRDPDLLAPKKRPGKAPPGATRLTLEMPVMRECLDVPGNALRFRDMAVGMVGKADFVLNGVFDITRSAAGTDQIVVMLTKCRDHVSANTCEHFQTWRFQKGVCRIMFGDGSIGASFQKYVSPRPACPAVKGTYTIRNATVDMKLLQTLPLPLEGNVWLVRFIINESSRKVHMCSDTEMRFHRVRDD